jgi:hypothetical protein
VGTGRAIDTDTGTTVDKGIVTGTNIQTHSMYTHTTYTFHTHTSHTHHSLHTLHTHSYKQSSVVYKKQVIPLMISGTTLLLKLLMAENCQVSHAYKQKHTTRAGIDIGVGTDATTYAQAQTRKHRHKH